MLENNETNFYTLTEEMVERLKTFRNNPSLIIAQQYQTLAKATDGKINVPDPTNPFSYLLETAAVEASVLFDAHDATYRKQYPRLATTYSDLYNHMFDEHYLGRFATPGHVKFSILFNKAELLKGLHTTDIKGVKQLIIPRGTYITVMDYIFTLLYNIEVKQMPHGGLHILYNTSPTDPIQVLPSNKVEWNYVVINDVEYIKICPRLYNVNITQIQDVITYSGYKKTIPITKGKFCHCRVYQKINGKNYELYTTHSDLVYDANKPTARLTYLEDSLQVTIPSIYFVNKKMGESIYIEIYTTSGKIEEVLNEYNSSSFSYQWGTLENLVDDSNQVAPLETTQSPIINALTILTGGSNGETFEQTRDRVINYTGYAKQPITVNQLETGLRVRGYDVLKSHDVVTSRSYFATRAMPTNQYDNFTSGAAASMETVRLSVEDIEGHSQVRHNANGTRYTILSNTLFKLNDGEVGIVWDRDNPKLNNKLTTDDYVKEINKLEFMYNPFHYVLDDTGTNFELRAYYLDKPVMGEQVLVGYNATSGQSVSSDEVYIEKYIDETVKDSNGYPEEGFIVRVKTTPAEGYEDIPVDKLFCQLALIPSGDKHYASINGKLLGTAVDKDTELKNYIWEFKIKTHWDINNNDKLIIRDFYMKLNEPRKYEIDLKGDFYFVYGATDYDVEGFQANEVDKMINREILKSTSFVGFSADKIEYHLGDRLDRFWSNGIVTQGEVEYERHEVDVPRVYRNDVYDTDSYGIFIVEEDNLKILHHAGDPVLDEKGNPLLLARKGDVVINDDGTPKIKLARRIKRQLDLFMLDGVYYFATDDNDIAYRNRIGAIVRDYIVDDLKDIGNRLLENTNLYFYPKRTMGEAVLIIDGGLELREQTRMSFDVTYYMDEAHYLQTDIRQAIIDMTTEVINAQLADVNVSTSNIISTLRERAAGDIIAVELGRLGSREDHKFTTYTPKDGSVRCSVKRIIKLQPDKTFKVVEDIDVNFVKHNIIEELKAR